MQKLIVLYTIILISLISGSNINAQEKISPSSIIWYTPEQADSIFEIQKKPLLIDVYTEWCGWCKHMMKTTFASAGIAAYINKQFIPVRFDAETQDTITFRGKQYINKDTGKRPKHEFAHFILKGRFSFPTIVYSNRKGELFPVSGYKDSKSIEAYLIYFAESVGMNNIKLNSFVSDFKFSYQDRFKEEIDEVIKNSGGKFKYPDTTGVIKWYSFEEAQKLQKTDKKPLLISLYTDWCHSCKVFDKVILRDSSVANIINENFYPIKFNAASQDTITFNGQTLYGNGRGKPHQFSYSVLKQSFLFPALICINHKNELFAELHSYMNTFQTKSIMSYYSKEIYMKLNYKEFLKTYSN